MDELIDYEPHELGSRCGGSVGGILSCPLRMVENVSNLDYLVILILNVRDS